MRINMPFTQSRRRPGVGLAGMIGLVGLLSLFSWGAQARGQAQQDDTKASEQETKQQANLEKAVNDLMDEAKGLDHVDDSPGFHWARPHPAIDQWGAEMGPVVLKRMQRQFTGDSYADTYIRWHLMYTVSRFLQASYEKWKKTGKHEVPAAIRDGLANLARNFPKPSQKTRKQSVMREPRSVYRKYRELREQTEVRVGYPPFDKVYHGQAAARRAEGQRKRKIQQLVKAMDRLRSRMKTTRDPKAQTYNYRIDNMNPIVRAYRGDVVYALVQTGDPKALSMITASIGQQIGKNQIIGVDLLEYMYAAAFDGYLGLYRQSTRQAAAGHLERIARRAEGFRKYMIGKRPVNSRREARNFADLAFTMVHILKDRYIVENMGQELAWAPEDARRNASKQFTAENLTVHDIRAAIQQAIHTLYSADDPALLPNYVRHARTHLIMDRQGSKQTTSSQRLVHQYGNQALISWALLQVGESYLHPKLYKRIQWVLSQDTPYSYDRGMRLQMLSKLPASRFAPWVRRDAIWLGNALSNKGNFPFAYRGGKSTSWGDHANGQYGMLGVWAAKQTSVDVPRKTLQGLDEHWRRTQENTPDNQAAGWALGMRGDAQKATKSRSRKLEKAVTGSMTAGGVSTLMLTERYLEGDKRGRLDTPGRSRELAKGLKWLDENFSLGRSGSNQPNNDKDKQNRLDWYYYMWTIQRVGRATGVGTFNGIDWFRQGTAQMLNRQRSDGLWRDRSGNQSQLVSTGFAMLYLGAALEPITISKIRFDGRWNNRPHDLWNFVDYASEVYEARQRWRIVDLSQPLYQLIESPILFLASDEQVRFDQRQIEKLRAYIQAGGLLVCNPDGGGSAVSVSYENLAKQLFPDLELTSPPGDYPLFTVHRDVQSPMRVVDNGIRPLMVILQNDLSKQLQTNDVSRPAFKVMSNIYLYCVGRDPRRERLQSTHIERKNQNPGRTIKAAILRHQGPSNPEPQALPQLAALLANRHGIDLQLEAINPDALSNEQFAYLTATAEAAITDKQAQAIRQWIDRGGTLWIDCVSGSQPAVDAANRIRKQIVPNNPPRQLSKVNSPIITGQGLGHNAYDNSQVLYRAYTLQRTVPSATPDLTAVRMGDRPAIIVSQKDITAGLAGLDQWAILGYAPDSARKLAANAVISTLSN